MTAELPYEVQFYSLEDGWLCLKLIRGEAEYILCPDGFMHDSMLDFVLTITSLWKGRVDEVSIDFYSVPTLYEFHFISQGDELVLRVDEYEDGARMVNQRKVIFEARDNRQMMCLNLWRSIRKFQSQLSPEKYAHLWKHPFPFEQVESLTKLIKSKS